MKATTIKAALTLSIAAAAAYLRGIAAPLGVLCAVMLSDYVTGVLAAYVAGRLSSRTGVRGILKKLAYGFAVGVAVTVDYVVRAAAARAALTVPTPLSFGLLVTVWLICNECLSILENLAEIGVPLPGFLVAVVKRLRKSAEAAGDDGDGEGG